MYLPRLPAYEHQTAALEKMRDARNFALLMAMRTGKSKVLLDNFGELELAGEVCDLLIIAPAGVYKTWVTQIVDHVSDDLQSRLAVQVWESGMGKTEKSRLEAFLGGTDRPRCLLMNVEALSRSGEAREVAKQFAASRDNMIAIDEVTIIKNNSKRTKFINSTLAPLGKFKRILSGLATPRSPLDLYHEFAFLSWEILGFRSYFAFRNRYAIMKPAFFGGRTVQIVDGYQHEDELKGLIEPFSFRVEFRPLIPSTYTIREVELTHEQRKAYDELKEFATTQLANGSYITGTVVVAQMLRLHQVLCGFPGDEKIQIQSLPENKTKELLSLLEDYAGKAIIWCSYDANVRRVSAALQQEYGPESVARFWGGNEATREDEEARFLASSSCRFMIATPGSGGRGRTWSNADLVVYFSSINNLEHRDQSEQRAMGIDKARQVDFVDLIAPGTIETKILEALRAKIDMASVINGDSYREWLI